MGDVSQAEPFPPVPASVPLSFHVLGSKGGVMIVNSIFPFCCSLLLHFMHLAYLNSVTWTRVYIAGQVLVRDPVLKSKVECN